MSMRRSIFTLSLISLATASFAAQPVNLAKQAPGFMQSLTSNEVTVKEVSRHVDFNNTAHVRVQQMFAGHRIWGADGIMHVPSNGITSMNGIMYQGLVADLNATPVAALTAQQAKLALQKALDLHVKNGGANMFVEKQSTSEMIVYVDKANKAHWAYLVSFASGKADGTPALPTFILDATTLTPYEQWDDIQTLGKAKGGGLGGNPKMGVISYDGLSGNYPILNMTRHAATGVCTLQNDDVEVYNDKINGGIFGNPPLEQFDCAATDPDHNNIYWDADQDKVRKASSPANDALYIGKVINEMYQKWYHMPALTDWMGQPMKLDMHVHGVDIYGKKMDNAFFFPMTSQMYYGDGVKLFYPLTSLGVGAHEISHGFTSQHSNLAYEKQSGGLNESFSDMAAQAAEFYSTGKNGWQIGPEIVIGDGALRYMDDPTKDGNSIDNVQDYTDDLNVHYSSGVFNKAFYLLATSEGWDTHKAFNVMVKANMDYWTKTTTFEWAACGVRKAALDYRYDVTAINNAFAAVGIDMSRTC